MAWLIWEGVGGLSCSPKLPTELLRGPQNPPPPPPPMHPPSVTQTEIPMPTQLTLERNHLPRAELLASVGGASMPLAPPGLRG